MTDMANAAPAASISFVVATVHGISFCERLLKTLEQAKLPDDEIIVLTRDDCVKDGLHTSPNVRVVSYPDPSIFMLRTQIPTVCRKAWVMMLEDHSLITPATIDAVRRLIAERPDVDLIPFLTKNLTSRARWDWAVFLHNFALVWAPLDRPPPFSIVTSSIVRRTAAFAGEAPLKVGEWELQLIPRLYASGRWTYSNDIFIDHIKPLGFRAAITILFHNARAGAAMYRDLGGSARHALKEGWYAFVRRPRELMRAVAARRSELPGGTRWRMHCLGFTHMMGNLASVLFGAGRSAHKVD